MLRILLLEDSPDDVLLMEHELKRAGMVFTFLVIQTRQEFEKALTEFQPDVVLSDHALPKFNSVEAFKMFRRHKEKTGISVPFILVTGNVSEEFAVQSIKAGIDDYILKDRLKRLPLAITGALEKCRMEEEQANYMCRIIAKQAVMHEAEKLAHFGSWQADLAIGKYTWSDETYSIYGFAPGEIEPDYQFFISMVHPDDRESLEKLLAEIRETRDEAEYEFRIIDKTGALKFISGKIQIQRDAHGKPVRLTGFNLDITVRKRAEIALEKREQEYRSLFDQNPDAVFSLDLQGRFTNVNKGVSDLTGYSREALQGADFRKFVHADDVARVYDHYLASLQRVPQRYQARIVKGGGKIITLDVTNIPIVVNNELIGVHGVAKDISEKKELESLLEKAYRDSHIGGWDVDLPTQKVTWTPVTREIHEVDDDYAPTLEKAILFYKTGKSRTAIRRALKACINCGTPWDLELQIVTAKGNERWVRAVGSGEIVNRRCVRLYGTFQDIHDRRKVEESLKEADREKIKILESIGDGFFAVDKRWRVTYWNKHAEALLQTPRENILGKNLWEMFGDAVALKFYTEYHKAMVGNVAVNFEDYYPRLKMWFQVSVYPSASGLSIYFKDVTEQKKRLREIEDQNIKLSQIAWIQSHEVRAPLARILGLVKLIEQGMTLQPELPGLLSSIGTSAQQLDGIIQRIVKTTEGRGTRELKGRLNAGLKAG
jgi:PAS domain S-box-containing protein